MPELNDIPTRWRENDLSLSPEAPRRRSRRGWTFGLALLAAAAVAVVVVFLSWLRPAPHPEGVLLWLATPAGVRAPAWAAADRDALARNPLFVSGGDALTAGLDREGLQRELAEVASRPHAGALIVALSGYARRQNGEVRLLAGDAESMPLRDVLRAVAASPAPRKLLILDLAAPPPDLHRGLLNDDVAAAIPGDLAAVPDSRCFTLVSCAEGQTPVGMDDAQRSAFSYYLDRGLRGAADGAVDGARDGMVTARELAAYVRGRVERWAERTAVRDRRRRSMDQTTIFHWSPRPRTPRRPSRLSSQRNTPSG